MVFFDINNIIQIIDEQGEVIKKLETAVSEKNDEVEYARLVNGLFKHEITNQYMGINGLICFIKDDLCSEKEKPELLEKIFKISPKITSLLNEWSDYQSAGYRVQWQTLPQIFRRCAGLHSNIKVYLVKDNISIISTPAIQIVMSSMVNNTAMHGGQDVSEVKIDWQKVPDGIVLVYEDNGVGIPDEQKSDIFKKGFGKHTGMGLFLAKEILKISGLEIAEKGTYGKGARFEIFVPEGAYKLY
jgi:signal transduction histidine kinase